MGLSFVGGQPEAVHIDVISLPRYVERCCRRRVLPPG
jgi:hypothetical protein